MQIKLTEKKLLQDMVDYLQPGNGTYVLFEKLHKWPLMDRCGRYFEMQNLRLQNKSNLLGQNIDCSFTTCKHPTEKKLSGTSSMRANLIANFITSLVWWSALPTEMATSLEPLRQQLHDHSSFAFHTSPCLKNCIRARHQPSLQIKSCSTVMNSCSFYYFAAFT